MADTWTDRDLPVLRAIVDIFEDEGAPMHAADIQHRTQLDQEAVQRALQALYAEPYLQTEGLTTTANGGIVYVGAPNGHALRAVGNWPTPESVVDRLIAAFEQAAQDDARTPEEKSKLKQALLGLKGAGYQVAIGVLSGAGGNYLST